MLLNGHHSLLGSTAWVNKMPAVLWPIFHLLGHAKQASRRRALALSAASDPHEHRLSLLPAGPVQPGILSSLPAVCSPSSSHYPLCTSLSPSTGWSTGPSSVPVADGSPAPRSEPGAWWLSYTFMNGWMCAWGRQFLAT